MTDYASNMERVSRLVELVNQPGPKATVAFLPLKHLPPQDAAKQLKEILDAKKKLEGTRRGAGGVELIEQKRTHGLVAVGSPEDITHVKDLLQSLDVPLGLETKTYHFVQASAKRADELVRKLIGPTESESRYQSAIDETSGILVVAATEEIHKQIESLKKDLDSRALEVEPETCFYKLVNATATEVLNTIRQIEGAAGGESAASPSPDSSGRFLEGGTPPEASGAGGAPGLLPQEIPGGAATGPVPSASGAPGASPAQGGPWGTYSAVAGKQSGTQIEPPRPRPVPSCCG